jgi:hypothetical protein
MPVLLGRGQQRPASDIPWSQVGRHWFLALWNNGRGRPTSLFLVNPAGGRYLIRTWPAGAPGVGIDDWSGDTRRALVGQTLVNLSTGATRVLAGFPDVVLAGFTRPSGSNVVLATPLAQSDRGQYTLVRVDLTGGHATALTSGVRAWVYAPDGASLVLDGQGALPVIDNSGHRLRTLPTPEGAYCAPLRWWPDHRLLVLCSWTDLWLVSPSGRSPERLTAPPQPGPAQTFGNRNVYPLGHTLSAQADGPCGSGYLAQVQPDARRPL